jgi:hypothetical protein
MIGRPLSFGIAYCSIPADWRREPPRNPEQGMSFLDDLAFFARLIISANRFEKHFMLSDRELAARGMDRQRLVRGYLRDLAAH